MTIFMPETADNSRMWRSYVGRRLRRSARCLIGAGVKVEDKNLEFAIERELDDIAEVLKIGRG